MNAIRKSIPSLILNFCLLVVTSSPSIASTPASRNRHKPAPNRAETKEAERRLSDMGYWTGRIDGEIDRATRAALIAFQKMEGRKITGRLTRDELEAIRNAAPPRARDLGYKHVEVDLDRQVLLLVNDEGAVVRILPVSTGSGKNYNENTQRQVQGLWQSRGLEKISSGITLLPELHKRRSGDSRQSCRPKRARESRMYSDSNVRFS